MANLTRKLVAVFVIGIAVGGSLLLAFILWVEFVQWIVRYEPWWR